MTDTEKKPENPAVFPHPQYEVRIPPELLGDSTTDRYFIPSSTGITLRDQLALEAMKVLIPLGWDYARVADKAYKYADAMLTERAKEVSNE